MIIKSKNDYCLEPFYETQLESQTELIIDLQWFASAEEEGRTEEPSEHKLRKAREEGRVAKSTEINGALVLLLPVIAIIILAPWIFNSCVEIIKFYFDRCVSAELTDSALVDAFYNYFIKLVLPIGLTAMVAGVVGNIVQTKGFLFSTKPIEPKFSKILPKFGQYFKKTIFSMEGAFNVFKSLFKVVILFVASYIIISSDLETLLSMMNVSLWSGVCYIAKMAAKILLVAAVVFLGVAIPDYFVQKKQFMESMKMTKQEVKQEYKDMEGDPLVKSRLRQQMRNLLYQNLPKAVSEADVVITNPTHYAVAVKYDKNVMQAPIVNAKGEDEIAMRIKSLAKENNVEIVENKLLARELYTKVEIGDIIPEEYLQAMAIILAKVYKLKGKR
ncbi:MAG: flagellar biosynthesis protein FlhB [Spirochaetaceae bacterium]|nr:flagellar biosynthesis protein FlhB [Spirochaetaceae bacterium]